MLVTASTFGPRSPGSSSRILNNSISAPLRYCLLSRWIAPLVITQEMDMDVWFPQLISKHSMNIYDTEVVKTLLCFLPVSPVEQSMLTTFLNVCNSLVISDKNTEKNKQIRCEIN